LPPVLEKLKFSLSVSLLHAVSSDRGNQRDAHSVARAEAYDRDPATQERELEQMQRARKLAADKFHMTIEEFSEVMASKEEYLVAFGEAYRKIKKDEDSRAPVVYRGP
jgi:hypothetical protein